MGGRSRVQAWYEDKRTRRTFTLPILGGGGVWAGAGLSRYEQQSWSSSSWFSPNTPMQSTLFIFTIILKSNADQDSSTTDFQIHILAYICGGKVCAATYRKRSCQSWSADRWISNLRHHSLFLKSINCGGPTEGWLLALANWIRAFVGGTI